MGTRAELDDSKWDEVLYINSYALFIGYISMAIKGLGFLILTWTTVVLLGGFVSMLQKKDFWCLTFITLVQTAGIFDIYQNEKLSYIVKSAYGLAAGAKYGIWGDSRYFGDDHVPFIIARFLLAFASVGIQMLVLAILLLPLAAVYVSGLVISTGISIWRLIQQDYGHHSDGEANLKPAMDTLYYLALIQGVLFCYRFLFSLTRKGLVKVVGEAEELSDSGQHEVLLRYLRETSIGCEKDPSFARGRNLITHAVHLIGSNSPDDCFSGVKMLYKAIRLGEKRVMRERVIGDKEQARMRWFELMGMRMMMKNLIISASPLLVLQKLLQTLDPRGASDRKTRNHGATIVAHLALDIHLEQFPGAINHICKLIGSYEEYRVIEPYHRNLLLCKYDQDYDRQASRLPSPGEEPAKAYEKLVLKGLCILWKLAKHESNRRIMSHTQGLLPRIMAPLTSDIIHEFNGSAWSISLVEGSLKVMFQLLVASPGETETGAKLRREISSNKEAIGTMEKILNCDCCSAKLQKQAMGILMQLYIETNTSRETYIKMLVGIFADVSKDRSIRNLAGEALAKLSIQGGRNTSIILQLNDDLVGTLTKILLLDDAENKICRIRAAQILEQMCIMESTPGKLKDTMTDAMPKVLAQILGCGLKKDKTQADQVEFPEKETDIENQFDNPQDIETYSFLHSQKKKDKGEVETDVAVAVEVEMDMEVDELTLDNEEDEEIHAPLLSLFVTVCDTFISADEDLACLFGAVDAISLPRKLEKMVADNNILTDHRVRLTKLTCKMVISMVNHRGRYLQKDLESLMEALSSASKNMSLLDISMIFASQDDGAAATTIKPARSLHSLVKEAKERVDTCIKAQESG